MKKSLINFYAKNMPNIYGFNFEDILKFDYKQLEEKHNYIQYLFPTFTRSKWNILAPTLDEETAAFFKKNAIICTNVKLAFLKMLSFYGFSYEKCDNFYKCVISDKNRINAWTTLNNHNFKRITRILTFLKIMEFEDEMNAFYSALYALSLDKPILKKPLLFWTNAIS